MTTVLCPTSLNENKIWHVHKSCVHIIHKWGRLWSNRDNDYDWGSTTVKWSNHDNINDSDDVMIQKFNPSKIGYLHNCWRLAMSQNYKFHMHVRGSEKTDLSKCLHFLPFLASPFQNNDGNPANLVETTRQRECPMRQNMPLAGSGVPVKLYVHGTL